MAENPPEKTKEELEKSPEIQSTIHTKTTQEESSVQGKVIDGSVDLKGSNGISSDKKISQGNPNWKKGIKSPNPNGRPKVRPFSIREDLIKSLKRIKHKDKEKYQEIIDSYWNDPKRREFLLEIIDGKAKQGEGQLGTMENPIRVVEVKQMVEPIK